MSKLPQIQTFHRSYSQESQDAVLSIDASKQLKILSLQAQNRSGGAANVGLGVQFKMASATGQLGFGQIDASETPDFVDSLDSVLGGTAVTIFTTTNNDGFLVQANRPFNLVGFNVSQEETGAPVYAYSYYNGTSYASLTPILVPDYTATGYENLLFSAPHDWVAGTTAAVGGSSDLYSLMAVATTAPSQAVQIDSLSISYLIGFQDALADNGNLEISYNEMLPLLLEAGESVIPFFGTAAAGNLVSGTYQVSD